MTNENRNFENKNVLITGGTSGIGIETARHFVSQGAQVILTGVTEKRIAEAQNEFGNKALVMAADLRNPDALDTVINAVKERYGHLDIVFANAGAGTASPLENASLRRHLAWSSRPEASVSAGCSA